MDLDKLPKLPNPRRDSNSPPRSGGEVEALPPPVALVMREELARFVHSKRVGSYLLGRTLGEGAFAKVKEGMHLPTGQKVAVKVIDKKKAREDQYVYKNLRREAKLLQMVRHRNIIQLFEVVETDNSYYLVTELCGGGELMDHICSDKHLDEKETKRLLRQIVSAVDHLHKAGIVHRDLKVENLLLDEGRNIKIIDFGLSNIFGTPISADGYHFSDNCHTQCGSPAYAAPELLGHKNYGPEVDVWSIGVNMYAMLTGALPFTVEPFNISVLHAKMLDNKMNPIPDYITPACRDLLVRLLNPRPEQRITLQEVFKHPWITDDGLDPLPVLPYPNRLSSQSLNESVLQHMSENMSLCYSEVVAAVAGNRAVKISAIYYLLVNRLEVYLKTHPTLRSHHGHDSFRRPQLPSRDDDRHDPQADTRHRYLKTARRRAQDSAGNDVGEERSLNFPTHDRRRSAPAASRYVEPVSVIPAQPKSLNTTPQSQGKSIKTSPPSDVTFRERANTSGMTKRASLRRVKTAQGNLLSVLDSPPNKSPTILEKPVNGAPTRRISAPIGSITKRISPRPRTVSLGDGRAVFMLPSPSERETIPEFSTTPTYHRRSQSDQYPFDDGLKKARSRSQPQRPVSLADSLEVEDDQLTRYTPNRAGSATVANRVIKTNPFFGNEPTPAGETLPAIATCTPASQQPAGRMARRNSASKHGYHYVRTSPSFDNESLNPLNLLSDRTVEEIITEIIRTLNEFHADEVEQKGESTVVARWNGVIFSSEVAPTRNGKNIVRFSRLGGADVQKCKEICERLANNLRI
eukprot:m.18291 g.18291  ORF g.18291 m.18291 type:complete len:802 (+) comp27635_c0_seq2:83-2488(+)